MSRLTIKNNIWYIHDFLKALGNNIRALFLIFDWLYWPFNAAVIACFWYFYNNIFSVISYLAFGSNNVSVIQIFRLHAWVPIAIFLFFCVEVKIFSENQLFVKSNQIHVSVMVRSVTCLTPKIGGEVFLPSYVILDSSDLTITRRANLEQLC